jgi:hypothetical protein
LSVVVSAANTNDSTMLEAVLDDIPPILMPTGRRRRRPAKVHADKAYDHRRCRAYLRRRGIKPRIARRMIESSERLGRHRWTIERTGRGWTDGGGSASAMSAPPSASMRWCCWLARSSASTHSNGHRGEPFRRSSNLAVGHGRHRLGIDVGDLRWDPLRAHR